MKKLICMSIALLTLTQMSHAEGLLGTDYIAGSVGLYKFGDHELSSLFGNSLIYEGTGNINLYPNIDVRLGLSYLVGEGDAGGVDIDATQTAGTAELVYFFKPDEKVNPFVSAGIGAIEEVWKVGNMEEDETFTGYYGSAGIEFETEKELIVRISGDYVKVDTVDDELNLSILAGCWAEHIFVGFGAEFGFETEDRMGWVGIAVQL